MHLLYSYFPEQKCNVKILYESENRSGFITYALQALPLAVEKGRDSRTGNHLGFQFTGL